MCLQVVRKTRLWQRNIVKRGIAGDSHLPIPASGGMLYPVLYFGTEERWGKRRKLKDSHEASVSRQVI